MLCIFVFLRDDCNPKCSCGHEDSTSQQNEKINQSCFIKKNTNININNNKKTQPTNALKHTWRVDTGALRSPTQHEQICLSFLLLLSLTHTHFLALFFSLRLSLIWYKIRYKHTPLGIRKTKMVKYKVQQSCSHVPVHTLINLHKLPLTQDASIPYLLTAFIIFHYSWTFTQCSKTFCKAHVLFVIP